MPLPVSWMSRAHEKLPYQCYWGGREEKKAKNREQEKNKDTFVSCWTLAPKSRGKDTSIRPLHQICSAVSWLLISRWLETWRDAALEQWPQLCLGAAACACDPVLAGPQKLQGAPHLQAGPGQGHGTPVPWRCAVAGWSGTPGSACPWH